MGKSLLASVEMEIKGNTYCGSGSIAQVIQSVLLGTDVPGLKESLEGEEKAHMVVTRGQACKLKQSQDREENVGASRVSGGVVSSVCEERERWLGNNSLVEDSILDQQESRVKTGEDSVCQCLQA